jgi:SAM-dependent methyltransferase
MVSVSAQAERETRVSVPEEWIGEAAQLQEDFCREIRKADPREVVRLLATTYNDCYNLINPYLPKYRAPRILEMGTGLGFTLCYLRKLGLDAQGIEPGGSPGFEGRYEMAIKLLEANGIAGARQVLRPAFGEDLPFADATFDIVYSVAVLEHVNDIEKCLTEAQRVLRPGGMFIMHVPNYDSFYEDHYDIRWLPYLLRSKRVAKWYVRTLFRRRDWFIDELHFTTPAYFRKLSSRVKTLRGMQVDFDPDFSLPILGRFFRRASETYHSFRDDVAADQMRLKDKTLMRAAGLAVRAAEVLRVPPRTFRLVWEAPSNFEGRPKRAGG